MTFLLLFLGHVVTAIALTGVHSETALNLDCTNDFEKMFCQVEAQNCTEYNLTIESDLGDGTESCSLQQCDSGRCCCTVTMKLILGETHTATVWRAGKSLESKKISVTDTVKPKTPTIISVNESKGNFEVKWISNMEASFPLTAEVTFYKKGDTKKVTESITRAIVEGLNYYEINGERLESSTTYMVSVRTHTNISGKFSDSSNECEFTTSSSLVIVPLAIIISLSMTAVILGGVLYVCYIKYKRKWWDTVVKDLNPKLLNMHPSKTELLKPSPVVFSPLTVSIRDDTHSLDDSKKGSKLCDTSSWSLQQSSGISTGSSALRHANPEPAQFTIADAVRDALHEALPTIGQMTPLTTDPSIDLNSDYSVKVKDIRSGPSCFVNRTYSPLMPGESTNPPSESNTVTVTCPDSLSPVQQLIISASLDMVVDDSYQQCNAESGRFSYTEDPSLSSISSDTSTAPCCDLMSRVEAECEDSGGSNLNAKSEEDNLCDKNSCHGSLVVDKDYQSLQSLVQQPDVSFPEWKSGEQKERLDKYWEEPPAKINQSVFVSTQSAPLIVISDYQSV
ncbi:uncharacterized protein LOC125005153 [Mugil cephalus]|uniref:uncharacterized protein LOC125005153 n=1 Tax=Mugil cephalus TaxID=48193 RepID=UPI001FB61E3F|nr:uncharacterized protein LOC125005153 [Mugil cephalus]